MSGWFSNVFSSQESPPPPPPQQLPRNRTASWLNRQDPPRQQEPNWPQTPPNRYSQDLFQRQQQQQQQQQSAQSRPAVSPPAQVPRQPQQTSPQEDPHHYPAPNAQPPHQYQPNLESPPSFPMGKNQKKRGATGKAAAGQSGADSTTPNTPSRENFATPPAPGTPQASNSPTQSRVAGSTVTNAGDSASAEAGLRSPGIPENDARPTLEDSVKKPTNAQGSSTMSPTSLKGDKGEVKEDEAGAAGPGRTTDAKPSDSKPRDTKPDDAKPGDSKPMDTKPNDTKPSDTKPNDAKPKPSPLIDTTTSNAPPTIETTAPTPPSASPHPTAEPIPSVTPASPPTKPNETAKTKANGATPAANGTTSHNNVTKPGETDATKPKPKGTDTNATKPGGKPEGSSTIKPEVKPEDANVTNLKDGKSEKGKQKEEGNQGSKPIMNGAHSAKGVNGSSVGNGPTTPTTSPSKGKSTSPLKGKQHEPIKTSPPAPAAPPTFGFTPPTAVPGKSRFTQHDPIPRMDLDHLKRPGSPTLTAISGVTHWTALPPQPSGEEILDAVESMKETEEFIRTAFERLKNTTTKVSRINMDFDPKKEIDSIKRHMDKQDTRQEEKMSEIKGLLKTVLQDQVLPHVQNKIVESIDQRIDLQVEQQVTIQLQRHLPRNLQDQVEEYRKQLDEVAVSLQNAESRRHNAMLRSHHLEDPLHPLRRSDGEISKHFPRSLSALFELEGPAARTLVNEYGLPNVGESRERNLNRFMQFCGVAYQMVPTAAVA